MPVIDSLDPTSEYRLLRTTRHTELKEQIEISFIMDEWHKCSTCWNGGPGL